MYDKIVIEEPEKDKISNRELFFINFHLTDGLGLKLSAY